MLNEHRKDGSLTISRHTLVAVVVMMAESRPQEKETMVRLLMHFLTGTEREHLDMSASTPAS